MVTPSELRFGKAIHRVSIGDIERLIQNKIGESHNLEYKRSTSKLEEDCNSLAETISGFLNTHGGIIVYGVSEKKVGKHHYPDTIKWCDVPKEGLEDALISKVEPWKETVKIKRIENEEREEEGIFVIEVPKSDNPPHMHNYRYYQRLNYQTRPMSHENVFRAFQTSWIRQKDLYQNVLEPLYAEIKENCEKINNYELGLTHKYDNIIKANRYLYDQIELSLRKKIEDFCRRIKELNTHLIWMRHIAIRIINEELSTFFPEKKVQIERNMSIDNLMIRTKVKYPDKRIKDRDHGYAVTQALSLGTTIEGILQLAYHEGEILGYEPFVHLPPEDPMAIPDQVFRDLWSSCRSKIAENENYRFVRKEIPKISMSGYQILRLISGR